MKTSHLQNLPSRILLSAVLAVPLSYSSVAAPQAGIDWESPLDPSSDLIEESYYYWAPYSIPGADCFRMYEAIYWYLERSYVTQNGDHVTVHVPQFYQIRARGEFWCTTWPIPSSPPDGGPPVFNPPIPDPDDPSGPPISPGPISPLDFGGNCHGVCFLPYFDPSDDWDPDPGNAPNPIPGGGPVSQAPSGGGLMSGDGANTITGAGNGFHCFPPTSSDCPEPEPAPGDIVILGGQKTGGGFVGVAHSAKSKGGDDYTSKNDQRAPLKDPASKDDAFGEYLSGMDRHHFVVYRNQY